MTHYETIIGLEVHAQLLTESKMFCGCSADYAAAAANTHVCPVCMALPGVLPVINRAADLQQPQFLVDIGQRQADVLLELVHAAEIVPRQVADKLVAIAPLGLGGFRDPCWLAQVVTQPQGRGGQTGVRRPAHPADGIEQLRELGFRVALAGEVGVVNMPMRRGGAHGWRSTGRVRWRKPAGSSVCPSSDSNWAQ